MTRPLRVVIATRLFTPEVAAGSFRLQALASALVEDHTDVNVVTTSPPKAVRPAVRSDQDDTGSAGRGGRLTVSRFPVLRDTGGNVRGYFQYFSFDLPLFFRLLFRPADVFVSEPPPTTGLVVHLVARIRHRPYVYYAADIWTDALNALSVPRPIKIVMRLVEGHVLRGATGIVAVSVEVADRVATFGVDSARIFVANNGVDTRVFTPVGLGLDHAGPVFVYTGTMSEWQGAVVFIEALARVSVTHPAVQLHFFGQGADESALRAAAARLGMDNVYFEGIVPPEVAATWLRSATAALASIKPGQGYDFAKPTKIYAAAACGTPVIFAGAGAGAVVVRDNALGWGTEYSVDDVVAAMEQAISEQASGRSRVLRDGRARWAVSNASLLATGKAAAQAVLRSARR